MKKIVYKRVYILLNLLVPHLLHANSFSKDFAQELRKDESYCYVPTTDRTSAQDKATHSADDYYQKLSKALRFASLAYATVRIYTCYTQEFVSTAHQSWIVHTINKTFNAYGMPFESISKRVRFSAYSVGIVAETLVYKTIAQLLLFCTLKEESEAAKETIEHVKKIAKAVVL